MRCTSSGPSASRSVLAAPIEVSDTRIGYLVVENESPGFFAESHSERLTAVT